jgi:dipeptidyl aminopeptidase/acylaminoacyl peptidase
LAFFHHPSLTLHGYLTLPKDVEAKKLPIIIKPHGGPWTRDVWGFNPEVQFFANRGIAVLLINFRGSTGYGKENGIDVQYLVKDNEGHGFANEENRFDFYRSMEFFLGKHLGSRVETAA